MILLTRYSRIFYSAIKSTTNIKRSEESLLLCSRIIHFPFVEFCARKIKRLTMQLNKRNNIPSKPYEKYTLINRLSPINNHKNARDYNIISSINILLKWNTSLRGAYNNGKTFRRKIVITIWWCRKETVCWTRTRPALGISHSLPYVLWIRKFFLGFFCNSENVFEYFFSKI